MLCTLDILRNDAFYAQSVVFKKYIIEHGIRCVLSIIFGIISISLNPNSLIITLVTFYVICFAINMWSIREMHRYTSSTTNDDTVHLRKSIENEVEDHDAEPVVDSPESPADSSPDTPSDQQSVELQSMESTKRE